MDYASIAFTALIAAQFAAAIAVHAVPNAHERRIDNRRSSPRPDYRTQAIMAGGE